MTRFVVCSGAETGAGGRIRDTHATGTGSIMGVATAGYCVGNLHLEGDKLPCEDGSFEYPDSLAPPLQVGCCHESNQASYISSTEIKHGVKLHRLET